MLGVVPLGLAFLRAVDAVEANAFRVVVVQHVESVAVEDGDDLAGEVSESDGWGKGQEACDREIAGLFRIDQVRLV
jgi:hypothetical protein